MSTIKKLQPFNLDNNASFTFGNVTANGNIIANGNISALNANLGNAATANFFVGNGSLLTGLASGYTDSNVAAYLTTYTGNISAGNALLGNLATANFFSGSGNNLSNIQAANITGTVANATYSVTAGTVTTAAQPNITSTGTLTSITTSGDATIGGNLTVNGTTTSINAATLNVADLNIILANGATTAAAANGAGLTVNGASATILYTSGTDSWDFNKTIVGNLTGIASSATVAASANSVAGANVSGQVANALIAETVTTAAQPNITSTGTLTSLSVTGNISGNNVVVNSTLASTSKTTGALTVAGGVGINNDLTVGNSITVDGGSYGNVVVTQFGSVFAHGSGPNPRAIYQARAADGIAGLGMQAYSGLNGQIYSNTGFTFTTGATVRDKDFPTGGTTRATVDSTGLTVTGIANISGNISALNANLGNAVTANYFVGSGVYITGVAAATATTVTANDQANITSVGTLTTLTVGNATANTVFGNGSISAAGNIAFTGDNVSLGTVANLHITGGTVGYFLQTDGAGNLSWAATEGGGGGAVSGSNTQIQFNDGGVLGASANLSFNKTSNTLSTDRLVAVNGANLGSVANVYISGGSANQILKTDGAGNLTWIAQPVATITVDNFTGTGTETTFTLSVIPTSINQTVINYNGAFQLRSAYTLSGANVIFTEAPESGSAVEVTTTQGMISGAGAFVTRTYTGNGIANTYAVTSGSTVSSVLVSENGLLQTPTTDYTISGSTLTFVNAPGSGIQIQVRELAIAVAEFSGNILVTNANLGNAATANYFIGSGNNLSNIQGANVSGPVANSTYATTAGTSTYATTANAVAGANVSGQVANALVAGTVYTAAQPNITSVGTLTSLTINGITTLGEVANIRITGGANGQVLTSNGASGVSWQTITVPTVPESLSPFLFL